MKTLVLHVDMSKHPPSGDTDLSQFRRELSRSLDEDLRHSGAGRWRGGRYARGVVTLFIETIDRQIVLERARAVLAANGLNARIIVADSGDHRLP